MLLDPLTAGLIVVACPALRDAVAGETLMDTGTSDIFAVAALVGSAALVAVTVTVCAEATVAGALYTPLVKVPSDGDMDQLTLVFVDPVTVAASVVDCPPVSVAVAGVTAIDTAAVGFSDMAALAVLVPSAALVAFTVTVCAAVMEAGALYTPALMVPTAGDKLQVTVLFVEPFTVAAKVADCDEVSDAVDGDTEIDTGTSDSTTLAVLLVAACAAAVTLTVCADAITAGAV